ncbi:MAG: hypothetical protein ABI811_00415 [Acidobacteriota bacterium]
MKSRALLVAAFAVILLAMHLPYLRLPFHWDELGQFVPAALDLFRDGAWIPHSTQPNIHPPGLMSLLAAVWSFTGFSILSARLSMLAIAAVGVYLAFLLAIRLARGGSVGTPAFAAVGFLLAAPMFYTQSLMVLLDVPAMVLTTGALLLFLDQRYAACAAACTALVLVKETALTTPMVFGAWLLFQDRRWRQALYFFAPAAALLAWLVILHQATGSWFGNPEFARYNVSASLNISHLLYSSIRRAYALFLADGHWIGLLALYHGRRFLRTREWAIAGSVALAQTLGVTILGGAVLDRYLLPVLPILYSAFAVAASAYRPRVRMLSNLAMITLLMTGWFVNSPFPLPLENNLSVIDFVQLQRSAAQYLESYARGQRVATAWPLAAALREPDFGYVQSPIATVVPSGSSMSDFRAVDLTNAGALVVFSHGQARPPWLGNLSLIRLLGLEAEPPEATPEEIAPLGFVSRARFDQHGQWVEIYSRPGAW